MMARARSSGLTRRTTLSAVVTLAAAPALLSMSAQAQSIVPPGIQMHIGLRPIAAFGNSDGDLQMLEWARGGTGVRFALLVHHTDGEREWAYDRKSSVGQLDKGLHVAQAEGWTIVDMKNDWKKIFPFGSK